jgi:hypothetical protein
VGLLDVQATLAIAALDLKLVRLLREAIRNADLAGGKVGPLGTVIAPQPGPRFVVDPTPRFEPGPVHHPEPRFEPRPVIHPQPREEAAPVAAPADSRPSCRREPALPAPWRQPVWKTELPPAPKVKVHLHRTDVHNKGSLIDLFL